MAYLKFRDGYILFYDLNGEIETVDTMEEATNFPDADGARMLFLRRGSGIKKGEKIEIVEEMEVSG